MRRILIVDDDPGIADGLTRLIGEKYQVAWARNGYAAMDKLKGGGEFDLILLDLRMPQMDGAGFVKELKKKGVETPVLVMSASDHAADQAHAMDAADYVLKPFHIDELDAKIEQLMGIHTGPYD